MSKHMKPVFSHWTSMLLLVALNAAFLAALEFVPMSHLILMPFKTFVTTLHEMGHATACVLTGGWVDGLTIVSDHEGHGGLTWCHGGGPFIFMQTGYLGAAFMGCVLLWLGRYVARAKPVLMWMGGFIAAGSLIWMGTGLVSGHDSIQELLSLGAGLFLATVLLLGSRFLSPRMAHVFLLILAGQAALNALSDVWLLIQITLGMIPVDHDAFSDATNMSDLGWGPASFWCVLWGAISVYMVWRTLKHWTLETQEQTP